jgi:SHS2 domain-containing protein
MGFEEISHTADWSVRVWADDLAGLVAESARALYALAGAVPGPGPRVTRNFQMEAQDRESLLVTFLSELVYLMESENLGFDRVDPTIAVVGGRVELNAEMEGAPLDSLDKAIKAVTWHNLKILPTPRGLETEIVFDV